MGIVITPNIKPGSYTWVGGCVSMAELLPDLPHHVGEGDHLAVLGNCRGLGHTWVGGI